MGLDQYAYLGKKRPRKNAFDVVKDDLCDTEFMYWRNNEHLQIWMEKLYVSKCAEAGIEVARFNCVPMELTKEDIQHLMFDIQHKGLEDVTGFDWGDNDYDESRMKEDLDFCRRTLTAMENDDITVIYDCWWTDALNPGEIVCRGYTLFNFDNCYCIG